MRRAFWWSAVVATMLLASSSTHAASLPAVEGQVTGLELCPQSICGTAVFAGVFQGRVGFNRHAIGIIVVAVTHEPLPAPGEAAAITGGQWEMRVGLRRLRGEVTGSLVNNGDETFAVLTDLEITSGGLGSVAFEGLLDHNVFPPTITGVMSQ